MPHNAAQSERVLKDRPEIAPTPAARILVKRQIRATVETALEPKNLSIANILAVARRVHENAGTAKRA